MCCLEEKINNNRVLSVNMTTRMKVPPLVVFANRSKRRIQRMHLSLFVVVLAVLFVTTSRGTSTVDYRLPSIFQAIRYTISIEVPYETLHSPIENCFTGKVEIVFRISQPTDVVKLHASHSHLVLLTVTLGIPLSENDWTIDYDTDILTVTSPIKLVVGQSYVLTIEYEGQMSTTDMFGVYKSSYQYDDNTTHYLVATQFQPTYAREAFPCFDEPAFKSVFHLDITVPKGHSAISNAARNVVINNTRIERVYFKATQPMSTYLVAFVISDFTSTAGAKIGGASYRVWSRNQFDPSRRWAVDNGPKLLSNFERYTDLHYDVFKDKLDQVAVPDFAEGAMENWGLVTYRELLLLWDPEETPSSLRQAVTVTMSIAT